MLIYAHLMPLKSKNLPEVVLLSYDIVIGGSGGQGVMSLVELLAECALREGGKVKVMKYKGLAQRGGSIKAFLRIGDVESPIVPLYSADLVVSLELAETLNVMEYVGNRTNVLIAEYRMPSVLNAMGIEKYPENIVDEFLHRGYYLLPAEKDLRENKLPVITLNTYMLGAISVMLHKLISDSTITEVLRGRLKRLLEENMKAYELGKRRMTEIIRS